MQLLIEQALASYVVLNDILPAVYRIYPAHGAEVLEAATQSYLKIIAGRSPNDNLASAGNAEVPVEFQLFSGGIEDESKIPAVTIDRDAIVQALEDLFAPWSFIDGRAALNTLATGVGFTGWEKVEPEPDGRTETQLVGRLKYVFECYLI